MVTSSRSADSPMQSTALARIRQSADTLLWQHVAGPWLPRCIDTVHGGFLCDFDRRWNAHGPHHRMLEFQARQTRAVARLAAAFPDNDRFAEYALHGFRYLRDTMWDAEHGGWYWMVAPNGASLAGGTKHGHSISYAVQACAVVYAATGNREALELAEAGFDWYDRAAYDHERGGYNSWLHRDGRIIHSKADLPSGAGSHDPISFEINVRDINVHGDWFEALAELIEVNPQSAARTRYTDIANIMLDRFTNVHGETYYAFHPDWLPLPQPVRFGYGFQGVARMLRMDVDHTLTTRLRERALAILDRQLIVASAGQERGFHFSAAAGAPEELEGESLVITRRLWWVQCEAARAMYHAAQRFPDAGAHYLQVLEQHLRFIHSQMIDSTYRGFYSVARSDARRRHKPYGRFGNSTLMGKGNVWKDMSHDVDMCLTLMGLRDPAPT